MNQVEEESLYHSLEEEAIDVDCLLVEPRSDQVWCFDDNTLEKCIKTEDVPYKLGVPDSNINVEGVDTRKLNALDVLPHEIGVENLLTTNGVSACDDYLLDIGYVDHTTCIDYGSNLHLGNSSSESQFPLFHEKGSFGIRNSLTENNNYFIDKSMCDLHHTYDHKSSIFTNSPESKTIDTFDDFSKSFIYQENNQENNQENQMEDNSSQIQDNLSGVVVKNKRSRKPTKRYIDESSNLNLRNCKKRKDVSLGSKVKISGVRGSKVKNEEKMVASEISFGKAIQVPFISQGPVEIQKKDSPPPTMMENPVEDYASGSEAEDDDSEVIQRSKESGNQRKHQLWTVSEVKKLIDGVAHFGVGKWTHIKKMLFSSSVHRTPVDLKDKWRNLLKASHVLKGSRMEDEQKRSQPWRPLPKSILCRVRELASLYPYPRENNPKISKSKFPLARHVSSPARIKDNQVPVV